MSQAIERLREVADAEDKAELAMAHNGLIAAMRAYNARAGRNTKEDYEAALALRDTVVSKLTTRYFPEETPVEEGERFKNRKQAWGWLQAQGYKVSVGKFYGDCDDGFPSIHRDGTVSRFQVMQYGQQLDVERRVDARPDNDREANEARKVKADADIAEMRVERERREMDNEWLRKPDAWAALAALVGTLLDALRHELHQGQGELVLAAGGNQNNGPQVYEAAEVIIGRAFNAVVARDRLQVVFSACPGGDDG